MERDTVHALLIQLHEAIQTEREQAKSLDMEAMLATVQRKETLLLALGKVEELHPDDRELARTIQHENRRNAFLFRATLNWIQDTMEFFGRKSTPTTYSPYGMARNTTIHGRLLSGRI
ncbi:MAG: flagellar protein FlgN [Desulfobulbus sp.]|jgi:flagellar biosynthesis/type III secretory pathway chaperone